MTLKKSDVIQPNNSKLTLQVMDDLTVQIIPNKEHGFLMTTKEMAHGYGTSTYVVQQCFHRNSSELIENKHYFTALTFCQLAGITKPKDIGLPPNAILWTKRGIVRAGFFIKSKQAKLFRDWAEDLIIAIDEQKDLFGAIIQIEPPKKRNHNRLTQERMISILADIAKIDDKELRLSLISKLGVQ